MDTLIADLKKLMESKIEDKDKCIKKLINGFLRERDTDLLTIPVVSRSLSDKENYFLHKTLIEKRLEKDEHGKYKIIQNPEEEKMLASITEKLIYA